MVKYRVSAGTLRQRVTLYALISEQDESDGVVTENYVPVTDCWADVRMASGREYMYADTKQSGVVATVKIRFRPGIEPSMRLSYKGRMLSVQAVLDDPESGNEWMTLACSDVRPG